MNEEKRQKLKELKNVNKRQMDDAELTSRIQDSLKRKFSFDEWALIFEFTGKNRKRADAIAFNLYPSRNFKIYGFEIKASRSDWKSELEKPSKNDYFVRNCDKFYVVAGHKNIVRDGELPDGWGLYEMKGGGKLYKEKESDPTKYQQGEPDRYFFSRAVQKAFRQKKKAEARLEREKRRAYNEGLEEGKEKGELSREQERLLEKGEKWEQLEDSELDVSGWKFPDGKIQNLAKAQELLETLSEERWYGISNKFGSAKSSIKGAAAAIEDAEEKVEEIREGVQEEVQDSR